ncbi:MAG: peroxide stress protein YaaA [Chlorobi bacterium]|nr:peroxide stress protein YaaA [Chlorobiota bacterium]
MLILLSPAKRLNTGKDNNHLSEGTRPAFIEKANRLAAFMKQYSPKQLETRLKINPQLALKAAACFASWQDNPLPAAVKPALLAYNGDAYSGLSAITLSQDAWEYSKNHLRILSVMYGILRPCDNIQAYRLEMGTGIKPSGVKNLYEYWQENVTSAIRNQLADIRSNVIINLASEEYFKTVDIAKLNSRVIRPVFKEFREGEYKSLVMYIKFARGRLTRFILENRLSDPEEIKTFDWEGYGFDANLSDENRWVFTR